MTPERIRTFCKDFFPNYQREIENPPMTDIAYRCGFASSSFFSTQFRNHLGENPTAYRNRFLNLQ